MFCALDKIDLAAMVEGRSVALQTDHRSRAEIEREPELSVLYAMTRVINARGSGHAPYYIISEPPELLLQALEATGAVISESTARLAHREAPPPSEQHAGELADAAFRALAHRVAAQVGTRDVAMALRMLEDQTLAAPPPHEDPAAYWRRVLELAALTGELLRGKFGRHGRWIQTDRALVPFGFELATAGGSTTVFPTNRAQRVIDDGRGDSLFKLVLAAEETLEQPPDATTGRLMPSLRDPRNVELDQIVWSPLIQDCVGVDLPIVVCGLDGESTFGMLRREAMLRTADEALAEALANLAEETVELGELRVHDLRVIAIEGSFYAAEKVLDRALMRRLHEHLEATQFLAAAPARGVLFVAAGHEPGAATRFAKFAHARFEAAGGRAISPVVWTIEDGRITGFRRATAPVRAETGRVRSETSPDLVGEITRPHVIRRRPGRKE